MTIRDYFAGQALIALAAHESARNGMQSPGTHAANPMARTPAAAYEMADAMLRARVD